MEAGKSTKRSSESCGADSVPDLELPVEPDFRPLPPLVSMEVMIARNKQFREWFPKGIPTEEERLAAKVSEQFVWRG